MNDNGLFSRRAPYGAPYPPISCSYWRAAAPLTPQTFFYFYSSLIATPATHTHTHSLSSGKQISPRHNRRWGSGTPVRHVRRSTPPLPSRFGGFRTSCFSPRRPRTVGGAVAPGRGDSALPLSLPPSATFARPFIGARTRARSLRHVAHPQQGPS